MLPLVVTFILLALSPNLTSLASSQEEEIDSNNSNTTCNEEEKQHFLFNSAVIFIKPHANNPSVRQYVPSALRSFNIEIVRQSEISWSEMNDRNMIDRHYYSISSKATGVFVVSSSSSTTTTTRTTTDGGEGDESSLIFNISPSIMRDKFSEDWEKGGDKENNRHVYSAMEACQTFFDNDPFLLEDAWKRSDKVVKFGGGFYVGRLSVKTNDDDTEEKGFSIYVVNGFYLAMRMKYLNEGSSVYGYEIRWRPSDLSWSDFRSKVIGPTDPSKAPKGSLRRYLLDNYKELDLTSKPNKGENGIHASASPFEGLIEKMNWFQLLKLSEDEFGKALIDAGISAHDIQQWSLDPLITPNDDEERKRSIFDELEDLDSLDCLNKLAGLKQ